MGIEREVREMEVRVVKCDAVALDAAGNVTHRCTATTTEFLPDVTDAQGGPILMGSGWLQLRTSAGVKQWYFCSHAHLRDWAVGPGADVLNPGVQPLSTLRTRSAT